jgi:hypothetical protein
MDKAKQTQIEKYGGEDGYKAEMKRRRALVKKPGFASMDEDKHKELSRLGGIRRWANAKKQTESSGGPC